MKKSLDKVNQFDAGGRDGDHDMLELIHKITHQYRATLLQAAGNGTQEVTRMDMKTLFYFSRNPGATLSDLADHSGRDRAQLARLIKGLRERSLLDGRPDPADRRNTLLVLTEAGAAITATLQAQGRRAAADALRGMSGEEKHTLHALLQRVSTNLRGE